MKDPLLQLQRLRLRLPEPLNQLFQIVIRCNFTSYNLHVYWDENSESCSEKQVKLENGFWQKLLQENSGSNLFNGKLCRLRDFESNLNSMTLTLSPIEYKTHVYAILKKSEISKSRTKSANLALGVSAVVVANDAKVLFIKRSKKVLIEAGKFDVFGGHIDPHQHFKLDQIEKIPDPFISIKTELHEELNLSGSQINNLTGIGLIKNLLTGQPELIFRCKTNLDSYTLIEQSKLAEDKAEYSDILTMSNEPDVLQKFCLDNALDFSPSGLGNIWVHSLHV